MTKRKEVTKITPKNVVPEVEDEHQENLQSPEPFVPTDAVFTTENIPTHMTEPHELTMDEQEERARQAEADEEE